MTERHVHPGHRLGKAKPRRDRRTLRVARYLKLSALPPAPSHLHLESAVSSWPMLGNDRWGDCVFADIGHGTQLDTAAAHHPFVPTVDQALAGYSQVTGFNPADPSTDQGTVWLDALNWWRKTGFAGHTITAYASVQRSNHTQVRQALDIFEGVHLGVALPLTAQDQIGKVWTAKTGANGAAGSWGGHAVPVVAYDRYHLWVVTWGALQEMTWGFFDRYCDEAYVALSPEAIDAATQKTPEGFDLAALNSDLAQFSPA